MGTIGLQGVHIYTPGFLINKEKDLGDKILSNIPFIDT